MSKLSTKVKCLNLVKSTEVTLMLMFDVSRYKNGDRTNKPH